MEWEGCTSDWSELIGGPMFARKTTTLIHKIESYRARHYTVLPIKPARDSRYDNAAIVTHDGLRLPAFALRTLKQVLKPKRPYDILAVDEISLFDPQEVAEVLAVLDRRGVGFVAAGLDLWADGSVNLAYGAAAVLAKTTTVLTAICGTENCTTPATMTRKIGGNRTRRVDVGGEKMYQAVCLQCWARSCTK